MLCKFHWNVLYTVHFTAFCLRGGGGVFPRQGVAYLCWRRLENACANIQSLSD